jgi:hypothetical protein
MKRREFLRKTGAVAAGSIALPYILPTGRLFASTGNRSAVHVVLVMFAGGVRQQESVLQRYLDDSQPGNPYPGNIMYNMLTGAAPTMKIAYGTGEGGINPIPAILNTTLQQQGTLFQEVKALSAGHYGGLNSILQGSTVTTQGLKQKPVNPTIFEYLRRHGGYKATDVWFMGNSLVNSTALLNYSIHENYGAQYGANFFCPRITFGTKGQTHLADAKVYHPELELDPVYRLKAFLDNQFEQYGNTLETIGNTAEEKHQIKEFMKLMYQKTQAGSIAHPPMADNADSQTIGYTCEVMKYFKPALTVVNLSAVDACHSNFTGYIRALHRADHAVGHLWNYIQNEIPEMAGNTVLIATPECGRNQFSNSILDDNNWRSYDHSDQNSLRVFSLMAGPNVPQNLVIGSESNQVGFTSDTMLTVADILGVKDEVMNAGMLAPGTLSLFDRI